MGTARNETAVPTDREPLIEQMVAIRPSGPKVIPFQAPLCAQCRIPMRLENIDPHRSVPLAVVQSFKCESCGLSDLITVKGKRTSRDLARRVRTWAKDD